jgi:hypothetical protein
MTLLTEPLAQISAGCGRAREHRSDAVDCGRNDSLGEGFVQRHDLGNGALPALQPSRELPSTQYLC